MKKPTPKERAEELCYIIMNNSNKSWFDLTFQEKLLEAHKAVLFPNKMDKNKMEFLSMIIQRLVDKVDGMTDNEINDFFE